MTYPAYYPTDRRYVHGEWPVSRHKFMANTEQRMLHATAKTSQELRLVYANQTTEVIQQFLYHYDAMYGMQYAFKLPPEVYEGWKENKSVLGSKQFWQYKDAPRITSQKGQIATLQVTLVTATTTAESKSTGNCPPVKPLPPLPPGPGPGDGTYEPNPGDGYPGGSTGGGSGSGPSAPKPSPSPGPGTPAPTPEPEPEPNPDPDLPEGVDYVSYWYKPPQCGTIYSGTEQGVNPTDRCTAEINNVKSDRGPYPHTLHKCETTTDMNDYPCSRNDGTPGKTSDMSTWNIKDGDGNFIGNNNYFCGRLYAVTTGGSFCVDDDWDTSNPPPYITQYRTADRPYIYYPRTPPAWARGKQAPPPTPEPRSSSSSAKASRFPDYHPSSRTYEFSDWNTKRFSGGLSEQAISIPLSEKAVASDGKLNLTFANRDDSVADDILRHYHAMTGGFQTFQLSGEILADWDSVYRKTLLNAHWIYDAPPQVTTSHKSTSTTNVRLAITKAAGEGHGELDPKGFPPGYGSNCGPELGPSPTPEPTPEPGPGPSPTPEPDVVPGLPPLPPDPGNPGYPIGGIDGGGGPEAPKPSPSPGPGAGGGGGDGGDGGGEPSPPTTINGPDLGLPDKTLKWTVVFQTKNYGYRYSECGDPDGNSGAAAQIGSVNTRAKSGAVGVRLTQTAVVRKEVCNAPTQITQESYLKIEFLKADGSYETAIDLTERSGVSGDTGRYTKEDHKFEGRVLRVSIQNPVPPYEDYDSEYPEQPEFT